MILYEVEDKKVKGSKGGDKGGKGNTDKKVDDSKKVTKSEDKKKGKKADRRYQPYAAPPSLSIKTGNLVRLRVSTAQTQAKLIKLRITQGSSRVFLS